MQTQLRSEAYAALIGALAAAGCGDEITVTEPPDVIGIVEDYREPTGELATLDRVAFAAGFRRAVDDLRTTSDFDFARSATSSIAPALDDLALFDSELPPSEDVAPLNRNDLAARLDVRFTCEGFAGNAPPDVERDGRVDLVAAVDDLGLFPLLWGRASACRRPLGPLRLQLDGTVAFFVDAGKSRIRTRDIDQSPILVVFGGDVDIEGERVVTDVEVDLRLSAANTVVGEEVTLEFESNVIEARIVVGGRSFVLAFADTVLDSILLPSFFTAAVRAADGLWRCSVASDFESGTCVRESDDERYQWP